MLGIDFYNQAKSWKGVPYLHQGRTRVGCDCIGFVIGVMTEVALLPASVEMPTAYARRETNGVLLQRVMSHCMRVAKPQDRALLLIQWQNDSTPTHVALHCAGSMLHCYQRAGSVVSHGYAGKWPQWTHSYWKLPGVVYE